MVFKRKIAFIDLSKNSVEVIPVPVDLRKKLLGGRGINMYLLSRTYRLCSFPVRRHFIAIFAVENPDVLEFAHLERFKSLNDCRCHSKK